MKKFLASLMLIALVLCSAIPSFAEGTTWDLSEMSFQELIDLRRQIDYELWNAEEWQEVLVPEGVYEIGVDIPAGHWSISVSLDQSKNRQSINIRWGEQLSTGKKHVTSPLYFFGSIYGTDHKTYEVGYPTEIDLELIDGTYLEIDGGNVIFKPYIGKPSLGFK